MSSSNSSTSVDLPMTSNKDSDKKVHSNKCLEIIFNRALLCHSIYFSLAYFIQGITDIASGFVNLPLQTILKDQLGLSPSQMGTFFFSCTITWSIKPLYGILSDFLPIFGYHRYSYLLITTIINLIAWLALYFVPISYNNLLSFCILAAFSLAFNDVLIDALMISVGRSFALIGVLQGIQQTSAKLASTISQIPAGFIALNSVRSSNSNQTDSIQSSIQYRSTKMIFLIAAICPIILFFSTLISVKERRRKLNRNNFLQTWSSLRTIIRCKKFWLIKIFLFFYSASPQVKTALFYYQRDTLNFDPFYVSILNTIYNGCGICSALIYLSIFANFPTKKILRIAIVLRIFSLLSYLLISDRLTSIFVAIFTGFSSEITNLAMLHLAAKSCPRNVEGTLFALFVSCLNFGAALGDWIGSIIFEYLGFVSLILAGVVWVSSTIFATCHIGEHGIQSTLENDEQSEDNYHYYDVVANKNPGPDQNDDDDDDVDEKQTQITLETFSIKS